MIRDRLLRFLKGDYIQMIHRVNTVLLICILGVMIVWLRKQAINAQPSVGRYVQLHQDSGATTTILDTATGTMHSMEIVPETAKAEFGEGNVVLHLNLPSATAEIEHISVNRKGVATIKRPAGKQK